jgi:small conductance mechanosensitive channel
VKYLKALQDQIDAMTKGLVQSLPSILIAAVLILITWRVARLATRFADRITRKTGLRKDLQQLIETLARLLIWIFGLLIAASTVVPGLTPASLFAGLGVGAVAIGFAFQDIFQNFLAGVLIMIREKMRIGDTIECQGITGKVERITLRETHIRQLTNELTIVPNSMLFKNPVKVLTDENLRRDEIKVEIDYAPTPEIEQTIDLIREAVAKTPHVSDQKPVIVVMREFGSNISVLVQWWTPSLEHDMRLTRHDVMLAIRRAVDGAGLTVPPDTLSHMVIDSLPALVVERLPAEEREEPAKPDGHDGHANSVGLSASQN